MAIDKRKLDESLNLLSNVTSKDNVTSRKVDGPNLLISKDVNTNISLPENKTQEKKRISKEESGIEAAMNPTLDKIADIYVQSLTGVNPATVRMKGIEETKKKTLDLISNYDDMVKTAKSPELKQKITDARDKLQKQSDYLEQYKQDYTKVSSIATLPVQLMGGLLSLVTGGAVTKEITKRTPSVILNTFKNNTKMATMLSKANQFGLTFSMVEATKEGVKQAQEGGINPFELVKKGATGYGIGALTGGPTGQFGKGLKGAAKEGTYQGLIGAAITVPEMVKDQEGWEKDMALNFAISSLFGLLSNKSITRDVRQQAVNDTKKAVAEINASFAEMDPKVARQKANQDIDDLIRESTGMDDIDKAMHSIDENTFYKLTDRMKEYRNVLSQEKTARIQHETAGVGTDLQMFAKGSRSPAEIEADRRHKTRASFLKSEYKSIKDVKDVDPVLKDMVRNELGIAKKQGKATIDFDSIEPEILANIQNNINTEATRLKMTPEKLQSARRTLIYDTLKQSRIVNGLLGGYQPAANSGSFGDMVSMMADIAQKMPVNADFSHPAFKRDISFNINDTKTLRTEFPTETLVYIPANKASTATITGMMENGINIKKLAAIGANIDTPFGSSGKPANNDLVFILTKRGNRDTMLPIGVFSDDKFFHTMKHFTPSGRPLGALLPDYASTKKGIGYTIKKAMFDNRQDIKEFEQYVNSKVAAFVGSQIENGLPSNVAKVTRDMPSSQYNIVLFKRGLDDNGKLTGKPLMEILHPINKLKTGKAKVEAELDTFLSQKGEAGRLAGEEFDKIMGHGAANKMRQDLIAFNTGLLRDIQKEGILSKEFIDSVVDGIHDGSVGMGGIDSTMNFTRKLLENKAQLIMNRKIIDFYNTFKFALPKGDIVEVKARPPIEINNISDINKALEPYSNDNTIRVSENGKVREYRIKDLDLYNAIANIPGKIGTLRQTPLYKGLTAIPRSINQLGRDILISLSLAFPIKDFIRNATAAIVNSKGKPDMGAIKSTFTKIEKVLDKQAKNLPLTPEESALVEFFWLGGDSSMMTKDRIDLIGSDKGVINKIMEVAGTPMKYARKPGEAIQEASDRLIRKAEYVSLRKAGMDKYDALAASKDVNIDWNEKGELSQMLNDNILFFNAAMKGLQKLSAPAESIFYKKLAKGLPLTQDESTLIRKFTLLTVAMIGAEVAQNALNNEIDPEGYAGLPDYEKNAYLIFMDGKGGYIRIPKAQEYGILPNIIAAGMRPTGDIRKTIGSTILSVPMNAYEQLANTIPAFDDSYSSGVLSALGNLLGVLKDPNKPSYIKPEELSEWARMATKLIKNPEQRDRASYNLERLMKEIIQKKGMTAIDNIALITELVGEGQGEEVVKIIGSQVFGGLPQVFKKDFDPMKWRSNYIRETMNIVRMIDSFNNEANRQNTILNNKYEDEQTKNRAQKWLDDNKALINVYADLHDNINKNMKDAYATMLSKYKEALESYKSSGDKETFRKDVKAAVVDLNDEIKIYLTDPNIQAVMTGGLTGASDKATGRTGL